jgi:uncharacterized protein (TIGR00251 family)
MGEGVTEATFVSPPHDHHMATLNIKVVPGASRDRIAGKLGDAIKVQVSAAPERGKANDAVINLIAGLLGLRPGNIEIVRGHTQPRKVLEINGIDQQTLDHRISELL